MRTFELKKAITLQVTGNKYRYTGGEDERGNLHGRQDEKSVDFVVRLAGGGGSIQDIAFSGKGADQFSWSLPTPGMAIIHNKNNDHAQVKFTVMVQQPNGSIVECDPMISNDPRRA
jgi:hypothetical protein